MLGETALHTAAPALLPFLCAPDRLAIAATSSPLLHAYRSQSTTLVLRPKAVVEIEEEEEEEQEAATADGSTTNPPASVGGLPQGPPQQRQRQQRALVVAGSVFVARRRRGQDDDPEQGEQQHPVVTLLAQQRCLGRLVVGDARALSAVAQTAVAPTTTTTTTTTAAGVAGGPFRRLNALVLEELGTDSVSVRGVARALQQGGMPCLQALEVHESTLPDERLLPIVAALRRGACPHLRRLLLGSRLGLPALVALGEALEARSNNNNNNNNGAVGESEGQSHLASLSLSISAQGFPSPAACAGAVARVVRATRTHLEELAIDGFGPLADGVLQGLESEPGGSSPAGAPRLRRLRCALVLFEAAEHSAGSVALVRGLAEKGLGPALAVLDFSGLQLRGAAFGALIRGIEDDEHLLALRELRLASEGLTTEDATGTLQGSLTRHPGPWQRLQRLDLSGNRGLRCLGLVALAESLGPGRALGGLEELVLERCCRGDSGALALFTALARGGQPKAAAAEEGATRWRLRLLDLGGCGLGVDSMVGLRAALSGKEDGGAQGAWAESLTRLALPKNPIGAGHPELAAALVAAGPNLALSRLDLWATGMGKDGALALADALGRPGVAPYLTFLDIDNQYPRLPDEAEAALRVALRARRRW